MKIRKGTIREDGMVFWKYGKSYKDYQYWITKEKYEKWKERENLKSLEYAKKNKEKKKKYQGSGEKTIEKNIEPIP